MKHAVAVLLALLATSDASAKSGKRPKAGAPAAAETVQNADGAWRIEATTTVGTCSGLIPGALTVVDHKIAGATGGSATSWGYVDEAGQIVARFTGADGRVVRLHGRLSGGAGSGAWSSSTDMCGGVWRATRG